MSNPAYPKYVAGLSAAISGPLQRVPVRARDGQVTLSAWRMDVDSDHGTGAIVLLEVTPGQMFYRGDGVFLGWPQERLASAYRALLPEHPEETETLQLG